MSRTEFNSKVRRDAWTRCKGFCEKCTAKLFPGKFTFDHIKPDGLDGEPTLDNCQVLCTNCHKIKTTEHDRPIMQKADNIRRKHLGLKIKRPWSKFRKKMNGEIVPR